MVRPLKWTAITAPAFSESYPWQAALVVAFAVLLAFAAQISALDKCKAAYVGGTLTQFQYASDHAEGRLNFGDPSPSLIHGRSEP
jgi:hypothetical protein